MIRECASADGLNGYGGAADSPTRSVRYAPTADGEVLIVGGTGLLTG